MENGKEMKQGERRVILRIRGQKKKEKIYRTTINSIVVLLIYLKKIFYVDSLMNREVLFLFFSSSSLLLYNMTLSQSFQNKQRFPLHERFISIIESGIF